MRMDGDDGCTTMWRYLIPWVVYLKMVKINFVMRIFPHTKKELKNQLNIKIYFWKNGRGCSIFISFSAIFMLHLILRKIRKEQRRRWLDVSKSADTSAGLLPLYVTEKDSSYLPNLLDLRKKS